jgi:hypothetical protein
VWEHDEAATAEEARLRGQARTWAWVCLLLVGGAVALAAYVLIGESLF